MCKVHYNRAPVTSATPHVWNHNSLVVQIVFISSHEIEHSFSNKAQRLVYRRLRCRTKRQLRITRSVADSSLVHSSIHIPPHFFTPLATVKINHLVPLTFFVTTACICATLMRFYHDKFLTPFVKSSTSPAYCTNVSSQYDGTHHNDNAQHGARYNSTKRTTLSLPGKSHIVLGLSFI